MKHPVFWLVVGSQFLYGNEVLDTVDARGSEMAEAMSKHLPYPLVYKTTVKTSAGATAIMKAANADEDCQGRNRHAENLGQRGCKGLYQHL